MDQRICREHLPVLCDGPSRGQRCFSQESLQGITSVPVRRQQVQEGKRRFIWRERLRAYICSQCHCSCYCAVSQRRGRSNCPNNSSSHCKSRKNNTQCLV